MPETEAPSRNPKPGTVAMVTMMRRPAQVALFDGDFWRGCDAIGPVRCKPSAITSIETPLIYDPTSPAPTPNADETGASA